MGLIAVVTGASRGSGKGIAVALGEVGATVYVTGRIRYFRCFIANLLMIEVEEGGSTFFGLRRSIQKLNALV
jgi:NAD(P)-dependent dehydrogenase (short-subunit alcohol dehydrogenase family)